MAFYTIKRIAAGVLSLFILATATFFLTRMMPGSPFQSQNVSETVTEAVEEEYGLKKPLTEQYQVYLKNLLRGDFGVSYRNPSVTVAGVISERAPVTAALGLLSVAVAAVSGTLLGIWHATSKRKAVRGLISGLTLAGMAIPNFAVALLLLLVFGVTLKWFPVAGILSPAHYVLPVTALAVYPAAVVTKLTDNTFREELRKDYILLARAKGLPPWKIGLCHVMKNACIPVLNYLGPMSAFLMTGSFVVESIFTIPGLGREFVSSITDRDYTMILGLTVFMGGVVIAVNLVTDLLCAWLDPRMRRLYSEKR